MYKTITAMVVMTLVLITATISGNAFAHKHHNDDAPTTAPVSYNGGFLNSGLPLVDLSGHNGDSILNRALCTNFNLCE